MTRAEIWDIVKRMAEIIAGNEELIPEVQELAAKIRQTQPPSPQRGVQLRQLKAIERKSERAAWTAMAILSQATARPEML